MRPSPASWYRSTRRTRKRGDVVVQQPAIEAHVTSAVDLPLGTDVEVRLVEADIATRTVRFELQPPTRA